MKYQISYISALAAGLSFFGAGIDAGVITRRAGPKRLGSCVVPYIVWDPNHGKFAPKSTAQTGFSFGGEGEVHGEIWHICHWLRDTCGISADDYNLCYNTGGTQAQAGAYIDPDTKQKQVLDQNDAHINQALIFNKVLGIGTCDPGNPDATLRGTIHWAGSEEASTVENVPNQAGDPTCAGGATTENGAATTTTTTPTNGTDTGSSAASSAPASSSAGTGTDYVGSDTKGSDPVGSDTQGSDTIGNGAGANAANNNGTECPMNN